MLSKLNSLILGLILLFVTGQFALAAGDENDFLGNSHVARVIVPKAIVYSDESMNSPLGYISNEKLITVGNPRKKNPDLVPLVVYGRLAFIEARNIHYENESVDVLNSKRGAPREHNIDLILTKPEEKLSENNSAYIELHQFGGGTDTKNLFAAIDGTDKSSYIGYGASLLHRQQSGRFLWGAGYEYDRISSSNIEFSYFMINPIAGYTPIKNQVFLMDLLFSLDLSVGTTLKIKVNSEKEPNAFIYGPHLETRVLLFPTQRYHFFGGLGIRKYKVLNIDALKDQNDMPINGISSISGVTLSLGFSFEI